MPRLYKKKRVYRKRPYKPKRKVRARKPILRVGGFPTSKLVKLRYVETISFDPGAGLVSVNAFRANSIFDPNSTGVGHQPSNHDRWANLYDRYTVLGSLAKVYLVPTGATAAVTPGTVLLHLSESGTDIATAHASGGIENILEQPRLSSSHRNYGNSNGPYFKPLVKGFSAKKFFGVKVKGVSPYTADMGANPTEGAFFEVAVASSDNTNDPGAIKLRVMIDYIVFLSEPKLSDAS